jgi:hypothetical protein
MACLIAIIRAKPDPGSGNTQRRPVLAILTIGPVASVCGPEICVDFAAFAADREPLLRELLRLENGLPSHQTLSRIARPWGLWAGLRGVSNGSRHGGDGEAAARLQEPHRFGQIRTCSVNHAAAHDGAPFAGLVDDALRGTADHPASLLVDLLPCTCQPPPPRQQREADRRPRPSPHGYGRNAFLPQCARAGFDRRKAPLQVSTANSSHLSRAKLAHDFAAIRTPVAETPACASAPFRRSHWR